MITTGTKARTLQCKCDEGARNITRPLFPSHANGSSAQRVGGETGETAELQDKSPRLARGCESELEKNRPRAEQCRGTSRHVVLEYALAKM